jgi:hypothetical protein
MEEAALDEEDEGEFAAQEHETSRSSPTILRFLSHVTEYPSV